MPAVATCRCGKRFLAQDHLLGKQVACPSCGQTLAVPSRPDPAAGAAAAPQAQQPAKKPFKTAGPSAPVAAAPVATVLVNCQCGRTIRAPESMRGRSAKCPGCGGVITVPLETGEPDIFGIGSLTSSDPFAAGAGPLAPANPLAPSPLHSRGGAAHAGSGPNNMLLIGIGGGAAALVVLILIVVVALSSGGGGPVADLPATESAPAPSAVSAPAPVAPPVVQTADARPSPPRVATVPAAPTAASTPPASTASPPADAGKSSSTAASSSSPAVRKHTLAELPPSLLDWHVKSKDKLVGMYGYNPDENPAARLSWMTALLPHLGYQKEYDSLQRDKLITDKANLQIAAKVIPEFQNPIEGRTRWEGYPFEGLALTHFAGMSGVEDARNVCAGQLPRTDPRAGVFGYEAVARPDAITDGASQTIMIVGNGQLASPWIMGGGATIRGAREPLFDADSGLGTRGLPTGGTMAVMADGSVRQIPAGIDVKVFRAMCTIHGAETIDREPAPAFNLEDWK